MVYRDLILKIVPPWLRQTRGAKLLYTFGLHIDFLIEMCRIAILHRFPGATLYEKSLTILGRDRKIRRGLNETPSTYRTRLNAWLVSHRRRGSPVELLRKVQEHYAPDATPLVLTSYLGRTYTMLADGTYSIGQVASPPSFLTADNVDARWARLWLEIDRTDTVIQDDGLWDDPGVWDDGGIWDRNLSPADIIEYRVIPAEWKAAHINPLWVVINNMNDPVFIEVP